MDENELLEEAAALLEERGIELPEMTPEDFPDWVRDNVADIEAAGITFPDGWPAGAALAYTVAALRMAD